MTQTETVEAQTETFAIQTAIEIVKFEAMDYIQVCLERKGTMADMEEWAGMVEPLLNHPTLAAASS